MELPENAAKFLITFFNTLKTESREWEKQHQPEILELKRNKIISELQLKHDIEEQEIRFKSRIQEVEMDEANNTQNFQKFLISLDEIRTEIIENYPQMPKALALLIYNHATTLLKEAWHNPDNLKKIVSHRKFVELTKTLTIEMANITDTNGNRKLLPEKTIDLITKDS